MRRCEVERWLEGLVREHRFTIAVVFPLVGAVLLVASAEGRLPPPLAFHPALLLAGILAMRLPLIAGVLPLIDRRAAALLVSLSAYAYAVEWVGLRTGWPYGEFSYGVALGPMLAGVPLTLPLLFLPLVLNAYLLALLVLGPLGRQRWRRLPLAVGIVLAVDLVLDPGAVGLGFWSYAEGGSYYGVPVSNFAGWLLSGLVAVVAIDAAIPWRALLDRLDGCAFLLDDLVSFVLLWGAINAFYANWLPVAVALLLAAGLVRSDRFEGLVPGVRRRQVVERAP